MVDRFNHRRRMKAESRQIL